MNALPANTHDLIAAIYAATLTPQDFNRVFDTLDSLLFEQDGDGERLADLALTHIDMARSIQERIGRIVSADLRLGAIAEAVPNPSYIIAGSETVLSANAMALAKYGPMPAALKNLVAVGDVLAQLRHYIRKDASGQPLAIAGQADAARKTQTSVIVSRIDPGVSGEAEDVYLLSIVDFGFDRRVTELFRAAYGLTQAESQVAVLLASGLRLSDIATKRGVSVGTVRTQIKIIKTKTMVRDLPGLVRLLCGFTASVAGLAVQQDVAAMPASGPVKSRRQITLGDGRQLDFLEQGAANGRPVLLFHNLPYGAELPAAAIAQAHQDGLRIIAPFRPGMGATSPARQAGTDGLLDTTAEDCRQLMQQLGIGAALLLCHSTGAPFALRLARLYPDLVTKMITVSRAPAWRPEWVVDLPQRQRFMSRLTMRFPQMLPVVSWAMIACMESRYVNEFVRHNCKDGWADAKATENQETVDLIARGSVDALRRSVSAFTQECVVAHTDFCQEARDTSHKFHILHGREDRIIPLAHSMSFVEEVPGTTIEVVEGAGQLMFYSHWQQMLAAVHAAFAAQEHLPARRAASA